MSNVTGFSFVDIKAKAGEQYYVFNVNTSQHEMKPIIDFSNPIFIFVLGLLTAFLISYSIYYVQKHPDKIDKIWKTFCGLLGLSGIGLLLFGMVYTFFVGFQAVPIMAFGLLFVYAGGSMLKDMEPENEIQNNRIDFQIQT